VRVVGAVLLLALAAAALLVWLNVRGEHDGAAAAVSELPLAQRIERGRYLALAGNCAGCHTRRGGATLAGGRAIETPFGAVYASNLTPDIATGIGAWSADDFWRALHNGRAKDGRLLYPAFPYPSYTQVTRADADALYAYLRSQPAVQQRNRAHTLRLPYSTQAALAVWRALYFRPGVFNAQPQRSAEWNRGAYLVRGLGHCQACHGARNALGASDRSVELGGGLIPLQHWYAPPLAAADDVVALLKTGTTAHGSALGPMAEVVFGSTQYLDDADLQAIASFLRQLPAPRRAPRDAKAADPAALQRGAALYKDHCVACHGARGEGAAGAYPPLAGSRTLTMASPNNAVRVLLEGGFAPATAGHPRPYGMPPFAQTLSNAQIADLVSYIRNAWGNRGPAVSELEVLRSR